MKLFIFESQPVQYHAPVYRKLQRICLECGSGSVRVFYGTDITLRGHYDKGFCGKVAWDEPLLEGYPAEVLHNDRGVPLSGFGSLTGRGVFKRLKHERPDAILLTGLAYAFDWAAYLSALWLRIPIWLRTETQDHAFARSWLKSVARAGFYRRVYARVQKALVIGKLNGEHYCAHGLGARRHIRSPYCVVDRFERLTSQESKDLRETTRNRVGFRTNVKVLMFCGKFQPKKHPDSLLEALAGLTAEERKGFGILYVGSGELEAMLRAKAQDLGDVKVHFAGFKNQTELPPYYLACDVLVLPSRQMGETWGLVVNEALLASRRVIISQFAGCHADFNEAPGVTVFDGSVRGLVEALRRLPLAPRPEALARFMHQYSVRAAAQGIADAMGLADYSDKPDAAHRHPESFSEPIRNTEAEQPPGSRAEDRGECSRSVWMI
jgi:glycosyltransferase involved in cell wall biosynthesis